MRLVIDTNVVVSAILRDRLPEKVLLFVIGRPDFEWVASPEILAEYREVMSRPKFALPQSILAQWNECFKSAIAEWPVEVTVSFPRDLSDAKFLACALTSDADFLITGDGDFDEVRKIGRTKVISVSRFHELVCKPLI
jgi:putative PIN family toxin of toxin-antitoxin system